jgi:GNAT superfamily N-acetyltransferase
MGNKLDTMHVRVRPVAADDERSWRRWFAAYREFYRLIPDDAIVDRVWTWTMDPAHETNALVAEIDDAVVGIANYRRFARPSTGTVGLWLDDLFTDPTLRGRGIGRALIEELQGMADRSGYSVVRWITASDNTPAQRLYDDIATRTSWVTYDAAPRSRG